MSVRNLLFDRSATFYRGNLHAHSTRSDGARSPEQVVGDYRSRGYDFLSLTDHFLPAARFHEDASGFIDVTDIRRFDRDDFVTVPGAEIHGPAMENGELWHFVANGLPLDFPAPAPEESGVAIARRAVDAGAYVSLAHPDWNAVSEIDALAVAPFVHGVEIYNHASEVGVLRGYGLHQTEVLLAKGNRLSLNAADDAHFKHPMGAFMDAFGGWVQVNAESLTADALVAALKAGQFYASQGPEFHGLRIDGDTLRIACSPVSHIAVSGRGVAYQRFHDVALIAAEAKLPDRDTTPYVRVTIADADGHRAWTNPIWL
jgi:predicted metal-dependent phosphoesterase TrpH